MPEARAEWIVVPAVDADARKCARAAFGAMAPPASSCTSAPGSGDSTGAGLPPFSYSTINVARAQPLGNPNSDVPVAAIVVVPSELRKMSCVKSALSSIAAASSVFIATASVGFAQVAPAAPPPPVLTAESKHDTCGWGLGGAAAGLGATWLLGSSAKAPVANWSGLYFGGHVGCALADTSWTFGNATAFSNTGDRSRFDNDGMIAGGQIGYNFQFGRWVLGLEASLSGGDLAQQNANSPNPFPTVNSTRYSSDIRWLFQATPRLGYTFAPNLHAYVKGGYATAEIDTSLFGATGTTSLSLASNQRHSGFTLGTGIEYMMASGVILGIDYSYVSLDASTRVVSCLPVGCGGSVSVYTVDPGDIHMITGRISFKVGGN